MLQAQSDDDEAGDDVAVNVDAGGFMEEFFEQVLPVPLLPVISYIVKAKR